MHLLARISKCALLTIGITIALLCVLAALGAFIAAAVYVLGPPGIMLGMMMAAVGMVVFLEEFAD